MLKYYYPVIPRRVKKEGEVIFSKAEMKVKHSQVQVLWFFTQSVQGFPVCFWTGVTSVVSILFNTTKRWVLFICLIHTFPANKIASNHQNQQN